MRYYCQTSTEDKVLKEIMAQKDEYVEADDIQDGSKGEKLTQTHICSSSEHLIYHGNDAIHFLHHEVSKTVLGKQSWVAMVCYSSTSQYNTNLLLTQILAVGEIDFVSVSAMCF